MNPQEGLNSSLYQLPNFSETLQSEVDVFVSPVERHSHKSVVMLQCKCCWGRNQSNLRLNLEAPTYSSISKWIFKSSDIFIIEELILNLRDKALDIYLHIVCSFEFGWGQFQLAQLRFKVLSTLLIVIFDKFPIVWVSLIWFQSPLKTLFHNPFIQNRKKGYGWLCSLGSFNLRN